MHLTAEFGMGSGGLHLLWPPDRERSLSKFVTVADFFRVMVLPLPGQFKPVGRLVPVD